MQRDQHKTFTYVVGTKANHIGRGANYFCTWRLPTTRTELQLCNHLPLELTDSSITLGLLVRSSDAQVIMNATGAPQRGSQKVTTGGGAADAAH